MLVEEAKCYYPLFRLGANVALIASGQYVRQAGLGDAVRT
jgi:ATP/ADP translocase